MARGLKLWWGVLGAGALAAVVWLLPLGSDALRPEPSGEVADEASLQLEALRDSANRIRREITGLNRAMAKRLMWDSVGALAAGAGPEEELIIAMTEEVDDGLAAAYEALVRDQLADQEMLPARVTLLELQLSRGFGLYPDLGGRFAPGQRTRVFHGEAGGVPYCGVVMRAPRVEDLRSRVAEAVSAEYFRPMNYCRFHARYGVPGDSVRRWLDRGAFVFALEREGSEPPSDLVGPPTMLFGMDLVGWRGDLAVERCLAGDRSVCSAAILTPGDERYSRDSLEPSSEIPGFDARPWLGYELQGYSHAFMADLERAFGSDAFERFWTSDASVPDAFQAAFGMPLGDYVHDWMTQRIQGVILDPAVPPLSAAVTLLFLLACAGGGIWTMRRVKPE